MFEYARYGRIFVIPDLLKPYLAINGIMGRLVSKMKYFELRPGWPATHMTFEGVGAFAGLITIAQLSTCWLKETGVH